MHDFTVVTFCTPEYSDCVQHFVDKCSELKLNHHNLFLPSTRSWLNNTRQKPGALMSLRKQLAGPLLYFDIDSLLLDRPKLPRQQKWDIITVQNPRVEHKNKVSSQCLWINDTIGANEVLKTWLVITRQCTSPDHPCLTKALTRASRSMDVIIDRDEESVKGCWKFNGQRAERSQATLEGAL